MSINTIYEGYLRGEPDICGCFERLPGSLRDLSPTKGTWAPGLADDLDFFQAHIGVPKNNLDKTMQVIITGQQPGLLCGPLYTVYKAITAIQIARKYNSLGTPCLPIFWTASDDHDFSEISTATLLTHRHDLLTLNYSPSSQDGYEAGMPAYKIPALSQLDALIDQAADSCFCAECSEEVKAFLHDSLHVSSSFSDWFARIMARLFSNTELRLFDPVLESARQGAVAVLEREMDEPLKTTEILNAQGAILRTLGYEIPIKRNVNACNFFFNVHGIRRAVVFENGRFCVPAEPLSYSIAEFKGILKDSPERFSPNVALRPIVQQVLFPVIAYVAGPGEIAYWAQLKPLFAHFGLTMPVVYPRMRGVITSIKIRKLLSRYDLDVNAPINVEELLPQALAAAGANQIHARFSGERDKFEEWVDRFITTVSGSDAFSGLGESMSQFRKEVLGSLGKLERRLLFTDKEKCLAVKEQLERLHNVLSPLGKPQERVLSIFSFLFGYGFPLVDLMLSSFLPEYDRIQELEL